MQIRILQKVLFLLAFVFSCKDNRVSEQPNNIESVTIGAQIWTLKNLDVDHYCNGDSIKQVTNPDQWAYLTVGAWCYLNNDPKLGAVYGKLYNWYAVNDSRGLAPPGWHVPTFEESTILNLYFGDSNVAGGKMKESGILHWSSPNTGATNESGFSALPGGFRDEKGSFSSDMSEVGQWGVWWCFGTPSTYAVFSTTSDFRHSNSVLDKRSGFSVRCVKN